MEVTQVKRESRTFYVHVNGSVKHVPGWSTPNEGYWWVPDLCATMREGAHLFDSPDGAARQALAELRTEQKRIDGQIRSLAGHARPRKGWTDGALAKAATKAMHTRGLTLRKAARAIGTSPATLSRFLRCQQVPYEATRHAIAAWVESD